MRETTGMLTNIMAREELRGLARLKGRNFIMKTIHAADVEQFEHDGWSLEKQSKRSAQVTKVKSEAILLEDRVWHLFYRLGFAYISGQGGGWLPLDAKNPSGPTSQIDVVAIDDEVAVAVECKSAEKLSRRPLFQEELGKFSLLRERFVVAASKQYPVLSKRQTALAIFTSNAILSENDKARAKEAN